MVRLADGHCRRIRRLLPMDRVAQLHGDRRHRHRIYATSDCGIHSNRRTNCRIGDTCPDASAYLYAGAIMRRLCGDRAYGYHSVSAVHQQQDSRRCRRGETVCVIAKEANTEWYVLDDNPLTRRLEPVYMHEDIIRALNPTPTPTRTFTPSPTTSPSPTFTKSPTPTPLPTRRQNTQEAPSITPRPTVTRTPASVQL